MENKKISLLKSKNGINYLIPFIIVTICFALWGFANDITNPMVKAFSKIFRMSVVDGTLVQVAFYGGYFVMALPAALFIKKYSYKAGLLLGLSLYAVGAFLFIPAKVSGNYYPFLLAYFILTCGLSFLETSANPYILTMGDERTATRRLNLAQSFNPIGSLLGMYVAMNCIQARLNPLSSAERELLDSTSYDAIKNNDLTILSRPYIFIGIVLVIVLILMLSVRMSEEQLGNNGASDFISTIKRLFHNKLYREGVITQFFYVGAQIMCWTFIIQYGTKIFMSEGMGEQAAEVLSQRFNIVAMLVFCISRFICTFLMKYFNPGKLLSFFAILAIVFLSGVIFLENRVGVYLLVGVSMCMSLMFPTIYGISLNNMGDDAKIGAAGLIMAILGGSLLPPVQASIIDNVHISPISSVNLSFIVPVVSFVVIAVYGFRSRKYEKQ